MPRGRLEEHIKTDLAPYDVWTHNGLLLATGSLQDFKNDYSFILSTLRDTLAAYDLTLLGLGYDPHNADCFLKDLEELGVPLLEVKQSARFLNSGTEDLQLLPERPHCAEQFQGDKSGQGGWQAHQAD